VQRKNQATEAQSLGLVEDWSALKDPQTMEIKQIEAEVGQLRIEREAIFNGSNVIDGGTHVLI
jgi:hypothetical protein